MFTLSTYRQKDTATFITESLISHYLPELKGETLSPSAIAFFQTQAGQYLMKAGKLPADILKGLSMAQYYALQAKPILALIDQNITTVEEICSWCTEKNALLAYSIIDELVLEEQQNWQDFSALSDQSAALLLHEAVLYLINTRQLSLAQLSLVTPSILDTIKTIGVLRLIKDQHISIPYILSAPQVVNAALAKSATQKLITQGKITPETLLQINWNGYHALSSIHIINLIETEQLSAFPTINQLNINGVEALSHPIIRMHLAELNIQTLNNLEEDILDSIAEQNPTTIVELLAIIEPGQRAREFHDAEGTMSAPIHQSAEQSAKMLKRQYGQPAGYDHVHYIRAVIIPELTALPSTPIRFTPGTTSVVSTTEQTTTPAAIRCLERLIAQEDFVPGEVGLFELISLQHRAARDTTRRYSKADEDILLPFRDAFYQIQRGNNLNHIGEDNGKEDKKICPRGAFNKIVEALHGLHPDSIIQTITQSTAAFKLAIIAKEEALKHLYTQYQNFSLLHQVKEDGDPSAIFNDIKPQVSKRFADEFAILFENPQYERVEDNPNFINFISCVLDTSILPEDVEKVLSNAIETEGPGQSYSTPARPPSLFLPVLNRQSENKTRAEWGGSPFPELPPMGVGSPQRTHMSGKLI